MRSRAIAARLLTTLACVVASAAGAAPREAMLIPNQPLADAELARMTGRFVLPNGVELALTVTSDTVVDGRVVLRTVLSVDNGSQLQVFGRNGQASAIPYVASVGTTARTTAGVTIALDRQSGIQTVTPSTTAARGGEVVVGGPVQDSGALGLTGVPVTPGGPAIATADGVVSLQSVRNGMQVTLSGDQLSVTNLVGRAVATAVVNSANDRTIDSVTNVAIDARNLAPYQIGTAQMRVDALALQATRGMIR